MKKIYFVLFSIGILISAQAQEGTPQKYSLDLEGVSSLYNGLIVEASNIQAGAASTPINISTPTVGEDGYGLLYDHTKGSIYLQEVAAVGSTNTNIISNSYVIAAADSISTVSAHATCDGTADDVEIQAGIAAVSAAGGGTVHLLAGNYYCAAVISVTQDNVTIQGEDMHSTVLHRAYNAAGSLQGIFDFDKSDNSDIIGAIKKMRLQGNKATYTGSFNAGVTVDEATGFVCQEVWIEKQEKTAFVFYDMKRRNRFIDCQALDTDGHGFYLDGAADAYQNFVEGCIANSNVGTGFIFTGTHGLAFVSNCYTSTNDQYAIRTLDNTNITNCHFRGPYSPAAVELGEGSSISNSRIGGSNTGDGIHIIGTGVRVSGCIIEDNETGIYVSAAGDRCTITGNDIYNNNDYGAEFANGAANWIVNDNNFVLNTDTGLVGLGNNDTIQISGNRFVQNDEGCHIYYGDGIVVTENTFANNGSYQLLIGQVSVNRLSTDVSVIGNQFRTPNADNCFLSGITGGNAVANTFFDGGTYNAFYVDKGTSDTQEFGFSSNFFHGYADVEKTVLDAAQTTWPNIWAEFRVAPDDTGLDHLYSPQKIALATDAPPSTWSYPLMINQGSGNAIADGWETWGGGFTVSGGSVTSSDSTTTNATSTDLIVTNSIVGDASVTQRVAGRVTEVTDDDPSIYLADLDYVRENSRDDYGASSNTLIGASGTWVDTGPMGGVSDSYIRSLCYAGNNVFYGGNQNDGDLYKSIDGGRTWGSLGTPNSASTYLECIAFANDVIIAGMGTTAAFYRSTDDGATWTEVQGDGSATLPREVMYAGNNTFIGSVAENVWVSTDLGEKWTMKGPYGTGTIYSFAADGKGRVISVCSSGTIRSEDYGDTWTFYSSGAYSGNGQTEYVGNGIWLAYSSNGCSRSDDGGLTFSQLPGTNFFTAVYGLHYAGNGVCLALGYDADSGVVARSEDWGKTWSVVWEPANNIWSSAYGGGVALAGTYSGGADIYRSAPYPDKGTWQLNEWGNSYTSGGIAIATSSVSGASDYPLYIEAGAGNAIADGWDQHSSSAFKYLIRDVTAAQIAQYDTIMSAATLKAYKRMPIPRPVISDYPADATGVLEFNRDANRWDQALGNKRWEYGVIAETLPRFLQGKNGRSISMERIMWGLWAQNKRLRYDLTQLEARVAALENP